MTDTPTTASDTPASLLERWNAQQTGFIRHRAERFRTIARVVGAIAGDRPRVLDLASGPGSLGAAVLEAVPGAAVTLADKDPVLLQIAADVFDGDERVTVVDADLDDPSWVGLVGEGYDAVISSTALHWLQPPVLARVYGELAGIIRPGGVFLNGDHLLYDEHTAPVLRSVAAADDAAVQKAAFGGGVDDWDAWWAAAEALPGYADAARERALRWEGNVPPEKVTLGFHLETLRSAGFRETGTVWQYLDDYVVYGIR